MSIKTSILLVITLVMISGYVFFVQIGKIPEVKEEPPWFYNVDMADMSRISIKDGDDEITFVLGDDHIWHVKESAGIPVGKERWSGVTLLLSGPKSRRLVDSQPIDLAQYGLDSPEMTVIISLLEGTIIHMDMGLPTPDGVGTYARVGGFPHVFTISKEWGNVLSSLVADAPYPKWYFGLEPDQLSGIQLDTSELTMTLMRENGSWHFLDEQRTPLNSEQLSSILSAFTEPQQQHVAYETEDSSQYGLHEPTLSIILELEQEDEYGTVATQPSFRIGKLTESGDMYYAQASRENIIPDIFLVDAEWVRTFLDILSNSKHSQRIKTN